MTRSLNPNSMAVNADYADALLTARKARNVLFLLILLMLLVQLGTFFAWRYALKPHHAADQTSLASATTLPTTDVPRTQTLAMDALRYITGVIDFLGITLSIVLAVVLLLIVLVMTVGRLIGTAKVTSAFIWCVLLVVLLFPWQAFLISNDVPVETMRSPATAEAVAATIASDQQAAAQPAFKIPGVLYTWVELQRDGRFTAERPANAILKWARFVGFPVVALAILLMIQSKSSQGLRFALGESDVQVGVTGSTEI